MRLSLTRRKSALVGLPRRIRNVRLKDFLRPSPTLWGQLVRYGLAGGTAAGVNILVYAVLWRLLHSRWPGHDYQVANVFGFLCGNIVSYTLSTRWVFEYRRLRKPIHEFGVYFAIGLVGLAWSALFLWMLVGAAHLHRDLAKIITVGIVFAWHFGARKVSLFSKIHGARVLLRRQCFLGTDS